MTHELRRQIVGPLNSENSAKQSRHRPPRGAAHEVPLTHGSPRCRACRVHLRVPVGLRVRPLSQSAGTLMKLPAARTLARRGTSSGLVRFTPQLRVHLTYKVEGTSCPCRSGRIGGFKNGTHRRGCLVVVVVWIAHTAPPAFANLQPKAADLQSAPASATSTHEFPQ